MTTHRPSTARSYRLALAALLPLLFASCTDPGDAPPDPALDAGLDPVPDTDACEPGTVGCECATGDVCASDLRGNALVCMQGVCVPPDCSAGATGCVCAGGTECDAPGDVCKDGVCKGPGCTAGTLNCDCLAGGCNAGLHCDEALGGGTCVDGAGYPGGACLENRLCYGQNRCDSELGICVYCEVGSQACVPREGGLCNDGLVLSAGRCLSRMDVPPAEEKRLCRMRCRSDYTAPGDFRACVDGFIEGCIGDLECVDGSCVVPGGEPPACEADTDCPDFQRCFGNGRCYSECDIDSECLDGYACYRHACRVPCEASSAASAPCPSGMHCDTRDGSAGVCMPLPEPGPTASTALRASYQATPVALALSNLQKSTEVTVTVDSQVAESFDLVKVSQHVYDASGAEVDDALAGGDPLRFVRVTVPGATANADGSLHFVAPARCGESCPVMSIVVTGGPASAGWARWEGVLELRHPTLGNQQVRIGYQSTADGRWSGTMYYFGSFPEENLAEWRAREDLADTSGVGNGLIQAWGTYRRGRLSGGFDAFRALLTATSTGSWSWPSVESVCAETFEDDGDIDFPGACFLYDDGSGHPLPREYVDDLEITPIPVGATGYPIDLAVRTVVGESGLPELEGVIDSSVTLHYPGDPSVRITFESSPFAPGACDQDGNARDCVVFLDSFSADVRVGGRMIEEDRCPSTFKSRSFPWLLTDFTGEARGGTLDECLDARAPFPAGSADNTNLARANPFGDGRAILRELRILDGALVDQRTLFVLFEETFHASVHTDDFSAYGYMLLEQADQLVVDQVFSDAEAAADRADTTSADPDSASLGPVCDPAWLEDVLGSDFTLPDAITDDASRALVQDVVQVMLTGRVGGSDGISEYSDANGLRDNVHYLCVDDGLIDGGADATKPEPCPAVSRVHFFYVPDPYNDSLGVRDLDCQEDTDGTDALYTGTCGGEVERWQWSIPGFVLDPLWRCDDPDATYCPDDRADPRLHKVFYEATDIAFPPLESAIQEAFRYKSRFQTDDNRSVGFAPEACVGSGNLTPYCYDAVAIEEILARIDCLLAMYDRYAAGEYYRGEWDELRRFLSTSLSYQVDESASASGFLEDGFERLYAELLIMLGDEAFTDALSSRFDLAASQGASFIGSEFETHGIDLSGIAGFEMRSLYKAAQYYDLATSRFFQRVAPVIRTALEAGDVGESGKAPVSQGLVTWYLERLIGGSTKKATTYSEIAVRYQSLNRPDLAEAVLERAYTATYLESVSLSRLMLGVADLQTDERVLVLREIENAQRSYQVALNGMREVLTELEDEVDVFGFTADYVPFPAVDDSDFRYSNAFEAVLGVARLRMETARRFEDDAILASREFETDTASFQSELVQIARSYEDRLLALCGGFEGRDGRVYPAIAKYADLSDATVAMGGSPCGRVGNGEIFERLSELGLLADEVQQIRTKMEHVVKDREDEQARARMQCARVSDFIDAWNTQDDQRISIQNAINGMQTAVSVLDRGFNVISMVGAADVFSKTAVGAASIGYFAAAGALEGAIAGEQGRLMQVEQGLHNLEMEQECASLSIDSAFRIKAMIRSAIEVQLEALELQHRAALKLSEIDRLRLEAQRIEEQQRDAEKLAVEVEAARNDPNIRVYRNAAVINADRSFHRALEHAYRATRMYEYYTSQSYAHRDQLYLIRMVARGTDNLVSYLDDLEDEYEAFRVEYRTRANRVRRISLLNDIFQVPYQDGGRELSDEERFAIMRERLLDPSRVDANGHRVVDFRTLASQTAPCTFNHQIDYVEVDFVGQNLGDEFANVLLWQDGTGVIESVADGPVYYRLPPALVVAQPHFNNSQRFDPSVYRRYELRERPFINTSWKLIFDQHDDADNQDVSIEGLKDIHIYVHYTDFTDPGACR